jgi:signal transduction histidine kinase
MHDQGFTFVVVVGTFFVLGLVGLMGVLMVVNTNRRHRHRAELAEMQLRHTKEKMAAEREAVHQTLNEVGKELHDNVSQLLMVIHIGINWETNDSAHDPRLDPAREALAECIKEVRSLGHTLNMDLWNADTFQEALLRLADRLSRTGKLAVHVLKDEFPIRLPGDVSTILYRVCQEVLTNAIKHSGATSITVALRSVPPGITISDNGRGFDQATVEAHAGLRNIERRCNLMGFEALCTTAPGEGCTWKLQQRVA